MFYYTVDHRLSDIEGTEKREEEARLYQDGVLAGRAEDKATRPIVTNVSKKSTTWLVHITRLKMLMS